MDQLDIVKLKQQVADFKAAGVAPEVRAQLIQQSGITPDEWGRFPEPRANPAAVAGYQFSPPDVNPLSNPGAAARRVAPYDPANIPRDLMRGLPMAAAIGTGLATAGTSVPAQLASAGLSSLAGNATDIVKQYVLGETPSTMLERAGSTVRDIATQLPFIGALAKYGAPQALNTYVNKLPAGQVSMYSPDGFEAAQRAQDFQAQQIPTAGNQGTISGSAPQKALGLGLSYTPSSMGTMQRNAQETKAALQAAGERNVEAVGTPAPREIAGAIVQKGAQDFKPHGQQGFTAAYQQIQGLDNLNVDYLPIKQQAQALLDRLDKSLVKGDSPARKVLNDILTAPDMVSFDIARATRSDLAAISRDIGGEVVKGKAASMGGLLAAKFHEQMDQAAKLGLESGAFKQYQTINGEYRNFVKTLEYIQPLAEAETPERAWDIFQATAKKYPTVAKETKSVLEATVSPEGMDTLRATHLDEMLRDNEGNFAPSKFAARWNNANYQPVKNMLFPKGSDVREGWDQFGRVASALKDTEKLANTSRTAPTTAMLNLLQGNVGGALGLAGGPLMAAGAAAGTMVLPWTISKMWTNPGVAEWMTKGLTLAPESTSAWTSHIARLAPLAGKPAADAMQARYQNLRNQQDSDAIQRDSLTGQPDETRASFNGAWDGLQKHLQTVQSWTPEQRKLQAGAIKPLMDVSASFDQARASMLAMDRQRQQILANSALNAKEKRDNLSILDARMTQTANSALQDLTRRAKERRQSSVTVRMEGIPKPQSQVRTQ